MNTSDVDKLGRSGEFDENRSKSNNKLNMSSSKPPLSGRKNRGGRANAD